MYKVRLSFYKKGYAKFVSHLDLMKMFQRVFRISGVDVTFSQGFNPHPKMSIAYPLPVGVTSGEEYLDLQVDSNPDYNALVEKINSAMPRDIKIIKAWEPKENMNLLCWAEYTVDVTLEKEIENISSLVQEFLKKEDIVIDKKTKKGISATDIKSMIKEIEVVSTNNEEVSFKFVLAIGEKANLKATGVIDAMEKYIPGFKVKYIDINREGIFKENMTKIDI